MMPPTGSARSGALAQLPTTFTYGQARTAGLTKHALYQLRDTDQLELLGRGLYRRTDAPTHRRTDAPLADAGLIGIATKAPRATLCLATALAHHGLSDAIPAASDIALPRGSRPPSTYAIAQWHYFDAATFDIGRTLLPLDPTTSIGLYSAERSIIDAFRTRGTEGHELGNEALKQWLRQRGTQPGQLLTLAAAWPRTVAGLRRTLEILL
jgi:predicted transcriptional regulator of viral defense system